MSLSDPQDTTKPDPWSLDPSFDIHYSLGGMIETTPGHDSPVDYYEKPISEGPDSDGGAVSGAAHYDSAAWTRGEKLKACDDEESGPSHTWRGDGDRDRDDAEEYHRRYMMLGLGGRGEGTASVDSRVSPAGTNLGSSSSPGGTFLHQSSQLTSMHGRVLTLVNVDSRNGDQVE